MSYLKGKDMKVQGDCLVHCFIKSIEILGGTITEGHIDWNIEENKKPEGFEKW